LPVEASGEDGWFMTRLDGDGEEAKDIKDSSLAIGRLANDGDDGVDALRWSSICDDGETLEGVDGDDNVDKGERPCSSAFLMI
jgi:hypothetical protein